MQKMNSNNMTPGMVTQGMAQVAGMDLTMDGLSQAQPVMIAITPQGLLLEGQGQALSELHFGRLSGNDVHLPFPMISRRHARIYIENGACWLEDLQSANGTFVNGVRISRQQLKLSDAISIADQPVRLQQLSALEAPSSFASWWSERKAALGV